MKTMRSHYRKRVSWRNAGLGACLAVLLASPAFAQTPGTSTSPRPTPPVMEELDRLTESEIRPKGSTQAESEESGRHFAAKKRERLMQFLQLDDATRAKLTQRLEQLDQRGEELRRQRREAFMSLKDQVKGLRKEGRRGPREGSPRGPEEAQGMGNPIDENALKAGLERVYAVEDAMAGLRRERMQVGRDLLTPEQQVRLLFFTMKFQKEMRERLQQERGGPDSGRTGKKR